eukprot:365192-Chlamydomonas_euryale.AAC.23
MHRQDQLSIKGARSVTGMDKPWQQAKWAAVHVRCMTPTATNLDAVHQVHPRLDFILNYSIPPGPQALGWLGVALRGWAPWEGCGRLVRLLCRHAAAEPLEGAPMHGTLNGCQSV